MNDKLVYCIRLKTFLLDVPCWVYFFTKLKAKHSGFAVCTEDKWDATFESYEAVKLQCLHFRTPFTHYDFIKYCQWRKIAWLGGWGEIVGSTFSRWTINLWSVFWQFPVPSCFREICSDNKSSACLLKANWLELQIHFCNPTGAFINIFAQMWVKKTASCLFVCLQYVCDELHPLASIVKLCITKSIMFYNQIFFESWQVTYQQNRHVLTNTISYFVSGLWQKS